jgi:hypothetical protein
LHEVEKVHRNFRFNRHLLCVVHRQGHDHHGFFLQRIKDGLP